MPSTFSSGIAAIRKNYSPWFDVADSFNNLGMRILPAVEPAQNSNQQLLAATLYGRALTSFQATYVLAERGMLADARTIVRAAAETTIVLSALVKDASVCDLLLDRHYWHHRKLRNAYLSDPQAAAELTIQEIDAIRAVIIEIDKDRPSVKDLKKDPIVIAALAEQADVNALYNVVYRSTSGDAAHTSIDAMNRHIRVDANNNIEGLIFISNVTDLPDTLSNAMSVLGFALDAVCKFFSLTKFDKDLEQCVAAWKALGIPSDYKPAD